jgi:arsenate reductase-like glutaredoxin family protein
LFKDLENYQVIPPKKQDFKEQFRDFLGNFELYVFLKKGIYFLKQKILANVTPKDEKEVEDLSFNWLQIKGSIYQTKKFLASKGVDYTVILYGKDKALTSVLQEFLQSQNIRYHDIFALSQKRGFKLEGFSCDSHWSDETHRKVAKLIKDEAIIE